jgi:hypothetical protein
MADNNSSTPTSKDLDIEIASQASSAATKNRNRASSKYKPVQKKSISAGLQFAPFARHVATANIYILLMLGIVDLAMKQRMKFLGSGIYAICVAIIVYCWHFISDFNTQEKLEDSVEANLEPRGWPKIICIVLTFFANYLVQAILCAGLSVYLFFSPQTLLCGIIFVIAALLYLVGFIRRENPKPITGIV